MFPGRYLRVELVFHEDLNRMHNLCIITSCIGFLSKPGKYCMYPNLVFTVLKRRRYVSYTVIIPGLSLALGHRQQISGEAWHGDHCCLWARRGRGGGGGYPYNAKL